MIKQLNRVHPLSRGLKVCLTFQEFGGLLSNDAAYDNNALLSTTGARLNAKGLDLDGTNPGTTGAQIPYGYSKYLSGNDFNTVHIRFKINSFTNTPILWSASGASNDYFVISLMIRPMNPRIRFVLALTIPKLALTIAGKRFHCIKIISICQQEP